VSEAGVGSADAGAVPSVATANTAAAMKDFFMNLSLR
jgi:hypothetical protein